MQQLQRAFAAGVKNVPRVSGTDINHSSPRIRYALLHLKSKTAMLAREQAPRQLTKRGSFAISVATIEIDICHMTNVAIDRADSIVLQAVDGVQQIFFLLRTLIFTEARFAGVDTPNR